MWRCGSTSWNGVCAVCCADCSLHNLQVAAVVWCKPVAVCAVWRSWWWTERPPKHVERFTRINNLRNSCIWLVVLQELTFLYIIKTFQPFGRCTSFFRRIHHFTIPWPPLWSSGQSFWLQIQRSRVRFLALPDFMSSSGSGTGSTQPREVNWGATWIKSSGSGSENRD